MMRLSQHVQRVCEISRVAAAENKALLSRYGEHDGISVNSPVFGRYMQEASTVSDPLVVYLQDVDDRDLECLVTLMYVGRDSGVVRGWHSFPSFHASIMSRGFGGNRGACISKLTEKLSSLADYLGRALSVAEEVRFDVDSGFPGRAHRD